MANPACDQAEGLRRMFVGDMCRMICVLAEEGDAGDGRSLAAHLAAAMGAAGSRVLLLDEILAAGEAHPLFAYQADCDLSQVLRGKVEMAQAPLRAAPGVDLLAGGLARIVRRPAIEAQVAFVKDFYRLAGSYDAALIAAADDSLAAYPSFSWAAQDAIILCGSRPQSVTAAYSRIKMLQRTGERRFHILFEPMPAERADALYRNIAAVSRRHLGGIPDNLGVLPREATARFCAGLAGEVLSWPLPAQKEGHLRAFMQRLLRGNPGHAPVAAARAG